MSEYRSSGAIPLERNDPVPAPVAVARPTDDGPEHEPATTRGSRRDGPAAIALVAFATILALIPLLTAVVVDFTNRNVSPLGDIALVDLHVRDVLSGHFPLVGPWSRYGWNHPGPALYYLIAPISAVAGTSQWGTMVGGPVLQIAAVISIAWLALRRAGVAFALAALVGVAAMYSTKGVDLFLQPWNPYVVFPFLFLLALAAWATVTGSPITLVFTTLVASFMVQTHISYTPFVLAVGGYVVGYLVLDVVRRDLAVRRVVIAVLWSLFAAAVAWLPPVAQEIHGQHGNLSSLVTYFTQADRTTVGLHDALRLDAANWRLPPPWLFVDTRNSMLLPARSALWLALPALLLVAGARAAWRTGARGDRRLVVLAGVLSVTGVLAYSQVEPPAYEYLILWRMPLTVFVWFACLWAVGRWVLVAGSWTPGRATRVGGALVAFVVIVWSSVGLADVIDAHGHPVEAWERGPVVLAEQSLRKERPTSVLVRQVGGGLGGTANGLVDELDRSGIDARIDRGAATAVLDRRASVPAEVDRLWAVVEEPGVALAATQPGARLLARVTPLGPKEERELRALQEWFMGKMLARGEPELALGADRADVSLASANMQPGDEQRLQRLRSLNHEVDGAALCRCAVVSYSARLFAR